MSSISSRTRSWLIAGAAAAGIALGAAGVAGAATGGSSTTTAAPNASGTPSAPAQDPAKLSHGPDETVLTGTTAEKVKAAALAAVPGSTIIRVETDSEGSPYEAHLRTSSGVEETVKVDANFKVTATEQGFGGGGPGGHGRGQQDSSASGTPGA
jgi:hypothetical protein